MSTRHQATPDCPSCAAAAKRPSGEFRLGCTGCCARAAGRSPQAHEARRLGRQTAAYRDLLAALELAHDQVKQASSSDFEQQRRGATV